MAGKSNNDDRVRALREARALLEDLANYKVKRVPEALRFRADKILRNFPREACCDVLPTLYDQHCRPTPCKMGNDMGLGEASCLWCGRRANQHTVWGF